MTPSTPPHFHLLLVLLSLFEVKVIVIIVRDAIVNVVVDAHAYIIDTVDVVAVVILRTESLSFD